MTGRALHIGVDGREAVGQPTGVGRYLTAVLREWAAMPLGDRRITIFSPAPPPADVPNLGPRCHWQIDAAGKAGSWWEQTRLPAAAARAGVDVFFAAGYTAPLRLACPSVLAIYDVSFFAHPEWFSWREGLRRRWLTRASARRARTVVTISQFSAAEIVRYLGIPRDRIVLAPPGAPVVATTAGGTRPPTVLFVGSLFNRRRIPDLLKGFAAAAARVPEARLILVGDNRTSPRIDPLAMAGELGLAGRVEWRAYVSDQDLDKLYDSARVFAFLSDYEGFGMTPLEAIAHGAPAVLLDTPVTREVYGDGAVLVPADPGAIGDALHRLLAMPDAHEAQLTRGRRLLEKYSWRRAAETILNALDQAGHP